jgi:hypothetical protein
MSSGAARPGGGVGKGTLLLLWKIWSQLSPILGENLFQSFSDFERKSPSKFLRFWEKAPSNFLQFWEKISLKFSPIFRENTLQNVLLTLSPIFKNTPLLLSSLRAAPGCLFTFFLHKVVY